MLLRDMNQNWTPPDGFVFQDVTASGAYLQVRYTQSFAATPIFRQGQHQVVIYVNDMGREVMRTTDTLLAPPIREEEPEPLPVGRRFRFKNGFLIVLQGLEEMIKCLS